MIKKSSSARYLPWVLFFFWLARPVSAQSLPALPMISEVFPAPSAGSEFIELHNPTDTAIDLSNWTLEDQLTTPSQLTTLNFTLYPGETYLVFLPTAKLNNSADGVTLKNASGIVVDEMSYNSSTTDLSWTRTSPSYPSTWSLLPPSAGNVAFASTSPSPLSSPLPSPSPTPTPPPTPSVSGAPSPTPTTPDGGVILTISEISACPETGQSEWVEVYNPGGSAVQLQNFLIRDASGNTELLNGTVPSAGYAVFFWSKSLLNNSGDSLFLLSNTGQILDSATYDDCTAGHTLVQIEGVWSTATPTPGKANQQPSAISATDQGVLASSASVLTPSPSPTPPAATTASRTSTATTKSSATPRGTPLAQISWWPKLLSTPVPSPLPNATTNQATQSATPDHDDLSAVPPNPDRATQPATTSKPAHPPALNGIIGGCLLLLSSGSLLVPALTTNTRYDQTSAITSYPSISRGPPLP